MAITRAQGASTSRAGGHPRLAEQSEANPVAPSAPTVSPPPHPQIFQMDLLAALAQQVDEPMAMVRELQEQHSSAAPPPPQPPPVKAEGPHAGHSHNGWSPSWEPHHQISLKPRHREASKRRRSPSRRSDSPHKRRPGKELEQSPPPLSRRITEEQVPPRFRLPQLDPYDGTTDPADHLESYKVLMQVQGATDALLCIAFPATLQKAARAWYSWLPPRSINSFQLSYKPSLPLQQ